MDRYLLYLMPVIDDGLKAPDPFAHRAPKVLLCAAMSAMPAAGLGTVRARFALQDQPKGQGGPTATYQSRAGLVSQAVLPCGQTARHFP
mmetsp:Transcript_113996/g.198136  ORF Transcript_113996/g.198136 Transcript_113996/m.198136 type:complete len:89 (-) Transcript_113996:81-347(-)